MFRAPIVRGRLTVPITCSVIATMLSFSAATAACGRLPAGTGTSLSTRTPRRMPPLVKWWTRRPRIRPITDPPAADQGDAPAATEESVEPAATDVAPDTTSKEALADSTDSVDPAKDESDRPGACGSCFICP